METTKKIIILHNLIMETPEKMIILRNLLEEIINSIAENIIAIKSIHEAYKPDRQTAFLCNQGFANNVKMQCEYLIKFFSDLSDSGDFDKERNVQIMDFLTDNLNFAENYFKEAEENTDFIFLKEENGNN